MQRRRPAMWLRIYKSVEWGASPDRGGKNHMVDDLSFLHFSKLVGHFGVFVLGCAAIGGGPC